jgi:hypothetical protein
MQWRPAIHVSLFVLSVLALSTTVKARTKIVLVGEDIPERLLVDKQRIFFESDSLYLNGQLLRRDIDYSFDATTRLFDLSHLEVGSRDTLRVMYDPVPDWVQWSYGRSLPTIVPRTIDHPDLSDRTAGRAASLARTDITISGSKTFNFSARSAGASNFGQSLDLRIQGSLAPDLEVTGAVSDRGYDPSYGPSNSRLSELDRVNLSLKSKTVSAQVGDLAVVSRFDTGPPRNKRISGANFSLNTPNWYAEALAARPRGRFESYRFLGIDGLQGPYQIGEGSAASPIVPGSEQVWLDGSLLERGGDKDYTIDYPTGQITFSVDHPIDRRSRIEIDYEPRATDYRGELLSTGGGAGIGDSALFFAVEFVREGDDKDLPLRGELSDEEKDLLTSVGDSVAAAFRSGITPDSSGNYVLVVDSLPDSIYRYVGEGNGDYTVSFSFVGEGKGDYRFLGTGNYQFVGSSKGDYLPIVFVPAPERTDYYNARVSVRNKLIGDLGVEFRQTISDRNLFSRRDDHDNQGSFYSVASQREWLWNDQRNHLTIKARIKEATFKARSRLYPADFSRKFLLPGGYVAVTDESLYELALSISPSPVIVFLPSFSRLGYKNSFESSVGGIKTHLAPHDRVKASFGWKTIAATDRDSIMETEGKASIYTGDLSYRLSPRFVLSSSYEHDRRENDYSGETRGTRYSQILWSLDGQSEKLSYEYYVEDSLTVTWHRILSRNRVSTSSNHKLGDLASQLQLTYQWLTEGKARNESFLGRLYLQYNNARKRLNVNSSYTLSEEMRNARGITYLEVEQGQGNYILENNEYIPDPDGNYIRIEEILSDRSRVSRGEKSFHLSKDFKVILIRFNSAIREELLDAGKRQLWWALPFLSDDSQPYLFYSRRYDTDIRMFPIQSAYAVNLTLSKDKEIRNIAGSEKRRRGVTAAVTFKQVVKTTFVEESLELFESNRDSYFSGGGKIDGFKIDLNVRQAVSLHEVSIGGSYRRAESVLKERSSIHIIHAGTRLRVVKQGELRASIELYRQKLTSTAGLPSFQLTDNKPGSRGAIWSADLRYGLKGGLRVNASLSGRHSDDRAARITGRGEMVVGF